MSGRWNAVKAELLAAVDQEIDAKRHKHNGTATPGFRQFGRAVLVHGSANAVTCVLSVDLRGRQVGDSSLDGAFAAATAADPLRYPIEEVVQSTGGELLVRVDAAAGRGPGRLWLFVKSDPLQILNGLRQRLVNVAHPTASATAMGHLTPYDGLPVRRPGLNTEQDHAVSESLRAGVNVVWGPPGTGKTEVIARAMHEALATGCSVLLVSNTNVAVDGPLLRLSALAGSQPPGVLVRVGEPALTDLANHPTMRLERACAALAAETRSKLVTVEQHIEEITSQLDLVSASTKPLEEIVGRFDAARIVALRARDVQRTTADQLEAAADERRERLAALRIEMNSASEQADAAASEVRGQQPAINARTALVAIAAQLAPFRLRLSEAGENAEQAAAALSSAITAHAAVGRSHLIRRHALRRAIDCARQHCVEVGIQLAEATQSWELASAAVEAERLELRSVASRVSDAEIEDAERRTLLCGAQLRQLEAETLAMNDELADIEAQRRTLGDVAPLSAEERAELLNADAADLDSVLVRLAEVDQLLSEYSDKRSTLMKQRNALLRELVAAQDGVVRNASVVATTLARLAIDKRVAGRRYDYVIIDEVSAALVPFVVFAASLAETGVTVLGDFMQNGPISEVASTRREDASRWLTDDYFSLIGVDSPRAAIARKGAGVTALVEQYRFVGQIADLANEVAYDGVLQTARTRPWSPTLGVSHPIVVIDTSALPIDLTRVRAEPKKKAGWWPAGAALTLSLARCLRDAGAGEVGIVTPYAPQAAVSLGVLAREFGPGYDCGTVHRFQGREFDNVIFDLVEPLGHNGWMQGASITSTEWYLAGAKLFNVAITRARDTLYIIADMAVIRRAAPRTALGALRAAIERGDASVTPAAEFGGASTEELLSIERFGGLPAASVAAESRADSGPRHMPAARVSKEDARDVARRSPFLTERMVYEQLPHLFGAAKREIRIWSPFIARHRLDAVLPLLAAAVERRTAVTVWTKPPEEIPDGRTNSPALLERLQAAGVRVRTVRGLHEKVVLIDDALGLYGSLNLLSHRNTSELMVRLDGPEQAKAFLDLQR